MQSHLSNGNDKETLSLFPFVSGLRISGDEASSLEKVALLFSSKNLRQTVPSPRAANQKVAAGPIIEWHAVSGYHVDDYGRPRILSAWEITLHALARPIVVGVAIGFGMAIFTLATHSSSTLNLQEKATRTQVAWQETSP